MKRLYYLIIFMLYPLVAFGTEDFVKECKEAITPNGSSYIHRLEVADPICRKAIEHHPKLAFDIGEKCRGYDNIKARYYYLAAAKGGIAEG